MISTFGHFINEDKLDLSSLNFKEFKNQLTSLNDKYHLETILGFNPKIVIMKKTTESYSYYVYRTRQDYVNDDVFMSDTFTLNNIDSFIKNILYSFRFNKISVDDLLGNFTEIRNDSQRTY